MDATTAYAVYVLAAVFFAVPAFVAGVFVFAAVKAVVYVVAFVVTRFKAQPLGAVAIPAGMTREQFDAWWDANATGEARS
jgi:hypothetical protein